MSKRQSQLDYEHAMLLRHHESTQELEYKQLNAIIKLRDDQLKKQHQTERDNQKEYNTREESNLRKKHLLEHKQQPRSLKVKSVSPINVRLRWPSGRIPVLMDHCASLTMPLAVKV